MAVEDIIMFSRASFSVRQGVWETARPYAAIVIIESLS
jgi:hypothetical protein